MSARLVRRLARLALAGAVAGALAACATTPPRREPPRARPAPHRPTPHPTRPLPRPVQPRPTAPVTAQPLEPPKPRTAPAISFSDLPGWSAEDHLLVFQQYRALCSVADTSPARAVCDRARRSDIADEAAARAFLQDNFRPVRVAGEGILTAYFTPEYPARRTADAEFSAPLRPRPRPAPVAAPATATATTTPGEQDELVVPSGGRAAYPPAGAGVSGAAPPALPPALTRTQINGLPADDALAWMRPEDLFFMQIQGSGVLDFPGGQRVRAITVTTNGLPFVGIAKPMRERGLLKDNQTSGDAIRSWLAAHRGPEADAIMQLNPRYGFFALEPYDGTGVSGAAGLRLPGGRAIAVDRTQHPLGGLYWISADAPALSGAFPSYRRAVMALDVGGAIKGAVRADLYVGVGEQAGREAGRVRHRLELYELQPRS